MLALGHVSYAYGDVGAVRDVSVQIGARQLIALTGPNGSGKSTLLKLIARVYTPHAGEVSFEGKPLPQWNAKEYARRAGYLPQDPDPGFPMRAIDVVVSGRAPYLGRFAWETDRDWEEASRALALCDAVHLADRYLDEMSGGERKRVFLARVLAGTPQLIVLDEPLAALDLSHVQQFAKLLRDVVDRNTGRGHDARRDGDAVRIQRGDGERRRPHVDRARAVIPSVVEGPGGWAAPACGWYRPSAQVPRSRSG